MLLINFFVASLIGCTLAVPDPNPLNRINDSRNPALVFATNGEGKVMEDDQKTGFRRSIPPGFGLGETTGFGIGTGLGLGTGLLGANSLGLGTGLAGLGGLGIGAGLGNGFIGNGLIGNSLGAGVGLQNHALGYRGLGYSPFATATGIGGFGATGLYNHPGLSSVNFLNGQGLMNNGFNAGFGSLNGLSGYSGLGINGISGLGLGGYNNFGTGGLNGLGINTFRNGFGGLNDLNGFSNGFGNLNAYNNLNTLGSLNNGVLGFSSLNALNTRSGLNNYDSSRFNGGGLNNFNSFNSGVGSGGFTDPTHFGGNVFGSNSFGDNGSTKRSPLDPTSPYYTQLFSSGQEEQQDSGFGSKRTTGTGTSSIISHSVGSQVRTNSNSSV